MMVLRVKQGRGEGKTFPLVKESVLVGRDHSCDVVINDEAASRKHAEIFRVGEMYFVRDLGSRNGTFVNERKVEEELLRTGMRIRIGTTVLVFEDEQAAAAREEEPSRQVKFEDEDVKMETTGVIPLEKLGLTASTPRRGFEILFDIAREVSTESKVEILLDKVADEVHAAVAAHETYIFVQKGREIVPAAVKKSKSGETVSRSIIRNVLQTKRPVLTSDARADTRFREAESIVMKGVRSVICAPLLHMDTPLGVIYTAKRSVTDTFSDDDLELVSAVGMMTGVALYSIRMFEKQRNFLHNTVKMLVAAAEMKDPSTKGHSERVSAVSRAMAEELGLPERTVDQAALAGLLHDVGKLAMSDYSLHSVGMIVEGIKGGKRAHHVILGEKILSGMPELSAIAEGVATHHEAFDGSGFPRGLKGQEIPLLGRIVCVANEYDHLTHREGVDKEPVPSRVSLLQIGKLAGHAFDPEVVKALAVAYRNGRIPDGT